MRESGHKTILGRRNFIRGSLAAAAGIGLAGKQRLLAGHPERQDETRELKIKEFRTLGRTGFKVSDIGFGGGNLNNSAVLAAALDAGVNYIDTAEHYVRGNSERTVGQVLKKYDRKKIFITTKLNFGMGGRSKEKLKTRFMRCLERMETDYADCLMIHMTPIKDQIKHEPYHEAIRELKAEGKVRFSGLSNHGIEHSLAGPTKDSMESVILAAAEDGRFDVVLFAYNFIQREQGDKILRACRDKRMGTTLMKTNPVKFYTELSASLERAKQAGRKIGEQYLKMIEEYKAHADQAESFKKTYGLSGLNEIRDAAIKFVLSNPGVHSACPTINSFDDLNAYLALSGTRLEPKDQTMLAFYQGTLGRYYCRHACGLCEAECPHNIPVNTIMRYQHYFLAQRREKQAMEKYAALEKGANSCSGCAGYCEQACPYQVPIQSLLIGAHEVLRI